MQRTLLVLLSLALAAFFVLTLDGCGIRRDASPVPPRPEPAAVDPGERPEALELSRPSASGGRSHFRTGEDEDDDGMLAGISFTVLDASTGQPLEGAEIRLMHPGASDEPSTRGTTDAEGRLRWSERDAPHRYTAIASRADCAPLAVHGVVAPVEHVIALDRNVFTIAGTVTGADSRLETNVRLLPLAPLDAALLRHVTVRTEDGGRFAFEGLARGTYEITAARVDSCLLQRVVDVIDRDVRVDVELEPTPTLQGRVVDAETGLPLSGAVVEGRLARVVSDDEGSFVFARPVAVSTRRPFRVAKSGYAPRTYAPPHDASELTVELSPSSSYAVRVLPGDYAPQQLDVVMTQFAAGSRTACAARVVIESDGSALAIADGFSPPPAAAPGVCVRCPGHLPSVATAALHDAEGAATEPPPEVALRPGGTIRGRVVDATGSPIAGARIFATPDEIEMLGGDLRDPPISHSDARGRFVLHCDSCATHMLTATADGFEGARIHVSVPGDAEPAQETLVTLAAAPARSGVVTGTVSGGNSRGVGAVVYARDSFGRQWSSAVDAEGRYVIEGIGAENVEIWTQVPTREGGFEVGRPQPSLVAVDGAPVDLVLR